MKKKLVIYLLAGASLLGGVSSCQDFLEEDNKTGQTADLTYSTKTGIEGLVATCYSYARGWYGKEAGLGLSEMGTDLFYYGYDNKQKSLTSYNLTPISLDGNSSDNACLDHYWEMFYAATDVCNNALKYVPLNDAINETTRSQYMGEAYFLRAFYYFHMVNIWGPIPYNSEPVTSISTDPERMPEEEVYSNILADLDLAIAAFEDAGYMTKADGRANYWAARALKARVLLYAASWLGETSISTNSAYSGKNLYSLAQTEAQAVIDGSYASFYDDYNDVWSMNNEDYSANNEALFGVTYSSDLTSTVNCIPHRYKTDKSGDKLDYASLITRTGYSRGGSAMLLQFVGFWNNGASDLGGNGKEIFVRALSSESTQYITNTVTGERVYVAEKYSPYSRGFTRYLPSMYLWQLLEEHRATDQRTEATLLDAYTIAPGLEGSAKKYPMIADTAIYYCGLDGDSPEGQAKQAWAKNRYRIQFMTGGDIPVYSSTDVSQALPTEAAKPVSDVYGDDRYNTYKIGGWGSFPGIKKFLNNVFDPAYPTHDISSRDAIVIRLPEMYLIKAECQLNTESGNAAMATINQLREQRAKDGMDNTLDGAATLETVLEERAVELCGEQQRWFDLKRTRTLVDHVRAYNAQGSDNVQSYHLLRPIPQAQMDAITNASSTEGQGFWQNNGYN
ncbi:RagB/SusD family nutrient uptake outer membrane protein [Mangrovibacterium marinum]|uniref:Putative outer membrane starch-binding protein n=1 Tax=Mangrovibacterium marinum TaxID=1639118 RepID=A0A2T5BZT3_9BACT|nr:RagB/SusD family nutrient uptake outer membrane protein [Mangrovibacterium marinum]PTN07816.1 putative outer membrane starch-binding protein [Mangrovibacterium marinum]